jgi:hypothetical protein
MWITLKSPADPRRKNPQPKVENPQVIHRQKSGENLRMLCTEKFFTFHRPCGKKFRSKNPAIAAENLAVLP